MTSRTPGPDVFGMNSFQPVWLETDPEGLHSPAAEGILLPTEFVPFSCWGKLRGSQVGQFLVNVMSEGTELRVHAGAKAKHGISAKKDTHGDSVCLAAVPTVYKDRPMPIKSHHSLAFLGHMANGLSAPNLQEGICFYVLILNPQKTNLRTELCLPRTSMRRHPVHTLFLSLIPCWAQEARIWASPEGVVEFSQHKQRFLQSLQKTRNQSSQARSYKPLLSFTVMVYPNTGHRAGTESRSKGESYWSRPDCPSFHLNQLTWGPAPQ